MVQATSVDYDRKENTKVPISTKPCTLTAKEESMGEQSARNIQKRLAQRTTMNQSSIAFTTARSGDASREFFCNKKKHLV